MTRRRRLAILAGVIVLSGLAFFWSRPEEMPVVTAPTQVPKKAKKSKLRKDKADFRRSKPFEPAPLVPLRSLTPSPSAAVSEMEPEMEPSKEPEPFRIRIQVYDEDGELVQNALVQSNDCEFMRNAREGEATVVVERDHCSIRAGRRDGLLMAWSEFAEVTLEAGQEADVQLTVPQEKTAGLGLRLMEHEDGIQAMAVIGGSPAETAGLQRGDVIVEIDGMDTLELSIEEFVEIGTGPVDTDVDLVYVRPTEGGETEYAVTIRRRYLGMPGS